MYCGKSWSHFNEDDNSFKMKYSINFFCYFDLVCIFFFFVFNQFLPYKGQLQTNGCKMSLNPFFPPLNY